MATLRTRLDVEIRISANHKKRTFTIRKNGSKYRTYPMSKQEFNSAENTWTGNDWNDFLRSSDYYVVK